MSVRELQEGYWRANRRFQAPLVMLKGYHRSPCARTMLIFNLYFAWAVRRDLQPLNDYF
jgi:hypothetical protein